MKSVCFIQPWLTSYRLKLISQMALQCRVDVVFSIADPKMGFGETVPLKHHNIQNTELPMYHWFGWRAGMYQAGIVGHLRKARPDCVVIFANPRYLSFWTTVFGARFLGIPIYAHGHGLYKKAGKPSFALKLMYRIILKLVSGYICYTASVQSSLLPIADIRKLPVADNSLENNYPVRPEEKIGTELGVLFLGRLRDGANVDMLVKAVQEVRQADGIDLQLHVIGGGPHANDMLRWNFPWLHVHGESYDQEEIRNISLSCFVGCYPGEVGLSMVHYSSLSLPIITHNVLSKHNPEASYIRDGINGFLFDYGRGTAALTEVIRWVATHRDELRSAQRAAYLDYIKLTHPPLADRMLGAIGFIHLRPERENALHLDSAKAER